MASDLELKLKIEAETQSAKQGLNDTAEAVKETEEATKKADKGFFAFGVNASLAMAGLAKSVLSATASLYQFAQSTLGLSVRLETSNVGLKTAGFLIQNLHKEFNISLGFLKTFADYLEKINFPITPITKFINLMSQFNVVVGVGKGQDTVFFKLKDGAIKAGEATAKINLGNLKDDIASAARSLLLFAANTAATFKSLKEGIARESAFSQASRTIEGTDEQVKALKKTLDDLAATDLSVTTQELYAVAGVAGAMGKAVEDIPQFVKTVSEGVVALNIPAEELAQRLGTLQTQLDLTEQGLISLSDQVNTVADTLPGKVSELDVFEVLSRGVATAGKNFGLLKGETVGLAGALLSLGEAPETARTSLVNLLSSLQNSKNQTDDFQLGLQQLGTSSDKLATDIKAKPLPALMQLLDTMNGMSNAARLDIATKLLGKGQDAVALAKLVDNTTLLKDAIKSATDETVYSGSVHAAYQKQIATTDSKITLLKNAVSNFSESLTSTFLPAIQLLIDGFRRLVNAAASFSQNHPIFKTFAAVGVTVMSLAGMMRLLSLAMTAVGLSPAAIMPHLARLGATLVALNANVVATTASLFTLARTGSVFSVLKTALSFLFGGTIGLAVGAIGLLVVGISNLLPATVKWGDTTATVGEIIAAAWDVVLDAFRPMAAIVEELTASFSTFIKEAFGVADVGSVITAAFQTTAEVFLTLGNTINFTVTTIAQAWGRIATDMSNGVQLVEDILNGNGIGKSFDEFTNRTMSNAKQFSEGVGQNFDENFKGGYALDKFTDKTDAALKRKRGEKALDEKDKRSPDAGADIATPVDAKDTKDLTTQFDEELKKRTELVKAALDQRKVEIELQAKTELEKQLLITQATKAANDAQLLIIKDNAQKKLSAITEFYSSELAKTQTGTEIFKALDKQSLESKLGVYQGMEKSYSGMISQLIGEEARLVKESKQLAENRKTIETDYETFKRNLHQIGLSDTQKAEEDLTRLKQMASERDKALKRGDFEEAARLDGEILKLGKELALADQARVVSHKKANDAVLNEKEGFLTNDALLNKTYYGHVDEIVKITDTAQSNILKTNKEAQNATKQRLDETSSSLAEAKNALDAVQTAIAQLNAELVNKKYTVAIDANTQEIDAAIERIKQPTESTHTVHVVEDRVQAHATGGYIVKLATGGAPLSNDEFKRRQGYVTGKGTSTSDEIPAMLSNTEYVLNAKATARIGKKALDEANFGDADLIPVKKLAKGGATGDSGDDRLSQRIAEVKKQQYEAVKAYFNLPAVQIGWSLTNGTMGFDPEKTKMQWKFKAAEYLDKNKLPREYLDIYLKELNAEKIMSATSSTVEERAKASLELDDLKNSFSGASTKPARIATAQSANIPSVVQSMSAPVISPNKMSLATPQTPTQQQAGPTKTIKFVAPNGNTTTGNFPQNGDSFFNQLETISGVTR